MLLADVTNAAPAAVPPTFAAALEAARHAPPARAYLVYRTPAGKDVTVSYAEALDRVTRLRAVFATWDLPAGARLLVATADEAAQAAALVAAWHEGLSIVVANPAAPAPEAAGMIAAAAPRACFVDEALAAAWPLPAGAPVVSVAAAAGRSVLGRLLGGARRSATPSTYPALLDAATPRTTPAVDPGDAAEAYVLFTSGSTAEPRGVRQSRAALLAHARTMAAEFGYDASTRLLVPLPTYHADGFLALVIPWLCGATALRPLRQAVGAAAELLDAVWRERATHVITVPTMLSLMLAASAGRQDTFRGGDLRAFICTAGLLDATLWAAFEERFGVRVANFYGMTETVSGGVFCGPGDATYRRGAIGRAVDCELRLVAADGAPAPAGEPGELCVRGANVMLGYLDPAATAAALSHDGWLRTGDMATIDAEGFVRLVGRKKNLVISGGQNIQPEEVTAALERLPGVAAAACFGVADELLGERLVACVVPRAGATPSPASLAAGLREHVAPFKVPRDLVLVDELPRGPSGKVLVAAARAHYLAQKGGAPAGGTAPRAAADIATEVRAAAAAAFRVPADRLHAEASPARTPGWDSFGHLGFVMELEQRFRIRLTPTDIEALRTLADAERVVHDRLQA